MVHYISGMDLLVELGRRVAELRKQKGISRVELARCAGLSTRFLAEVESGRGNISLARLLDLSRALDRPLSALISSLPTANRSANRSSALYSSILSKLASCNPSQLRQIERWFLQNRPRKRETVALVGLRGAGKTTVGRKLAAALRVPFVELDDLVEREAGLALSDIFEVHGEDYYRELEHQALVRFLGGTARAVLAVGGGIVTHEDSFTLLRSQCVTVWLRARAEDHWTRVLEQDPRPMADRPDAMQQLRLLLERREPLYALADLTIDTSSLTSEEACKQISESLLHLPRGAGRGC